MAVPFDKELQCHPFDKGLWLHPFDKGQRLHPCQRLHPFDKGLSCLSCWHFWQGFLPLFSFSSQPLSSLPSPPQQLSPPASSSQHPKGQGSFHVCQVTSDFFCCSSSSLSLLAFSFWQGPPSGWLPFPLLPFWQGPHPPPSFFFSLLPSVVPPPFPSFLFLPFLFSLFPPPPFHRFFFGIQFADPSCCILLFLPALLCRHLFWHATLSQTLVACFACSQAPFLSLLLFLFLYLLARYLFLLFLFQLRPPWLPLDKGTLLSRVSAFVKHCAFVKPKMPFVKAGPLLSRVVFKNATSSEKNQGLSEKGSGSQAFKLQNKHLAGCANKQEIISWIPQNSKKVLLGFLRQMILFLACGFSSCYQKLVLPICLETILPPDFFIY